MCSRSLPDPDVLADDEEIAERLDAWRECRRGEGRIGCEDVDGVPSAETAPAGLVAVEVEPNVGGSFRRFLCRVDWDLRDDRALRSSRGSDRGGGATTGPAPLPPAPASSRMLPRSLP